MKQKYAQICEEYVLAFMRKHSFYCDRTGEYYDYDWVADDIGGILCVADYHIGFDDIRIDIDNEIHKSVYFEYYEYCLENESKINYKSYLKGAREEKK